MPTTMYPEMLKIREMRNGIVLAQRIAGSTLIATHALAHPRLDFTGGRSARHVIDV
jgi:hypothetical protein